MTAPLSTDMLLPLKPEEISAEWLSAALQIGHPRVEVEVAKIENVILGTSTKIRVRLQYRLGHDGGLPPTMIVKGGFEEHSPLMKDMYLLETRAYRDVMPFLELNVPRCYYAGSDPASHQSIVVLEDLRAKNVTFCHAQQPQNFLQVAARLTALARFHAQTWGSAELKPGGRWPWLIGRHEGHFQAYIDRYLDLERWRHYVRSPRGAAISSTLHDREWMRDALAQLGEYHKRFPECLVHGDTHLGNLYIEKDGTPGFFDMQVSRGPWQLEVAYHLVAALDIADRRRWEQALLMHYLEQLTQHGVVAPTFEEAWDAYRREILYGLFIFLINETRFQTEAVNTAYAARFGAAMLDHGTKRLLS